MGRSLEFFPDWRAHNPYQQLLFGSLAARGVELVPVRDLLGHLTGGTGGLLNVHWTTPLLARAASAQEADGVVAALASALAVFRANGGRLIWTLHNVLPHDARFPAQEASVARLLAEHATVVQVLSRATLTATEPHYRLDPERVVVIEHSSYLGHYPDHVTREQARDRLRIGSGDAVLVTLGRVRPYKGLGALLDAFDVLVAEDPSLRLLVVGPTGQDPAVADLVARVRATPRVHGRFARVPDQRMQRWLRAADLAALPYARILNSGSFLLAETFGLPVVAPRAGSLAERDGEEHVRLFDPGGLEETLRGAVRELVHDPDGAARARASAERAARVRRPEVMAAEFADLVDQVAAGAFTRP